MSREARASVARASVSLARGWLDLHALARRVPP